MKATLPGRQRPVSTLSIFATILLITTRATVFAQQLFQTYCSNENTGSDNEPIYWHWMSLGYCQTACQDNFAYAVVSSKTCWCSNYAPYNQQDVSLCSETCPGFPPEYCGSAGGLFGYLKLRLAPSGTIGAPTAPPVLTTKVIYSTINPSTITLISVNTVVSTEIQTETPSANPKSSETVVTRVVTSVQSVSAVATIPASDGPPPVVQDKSSGLSGGAVAGAVIGVLAGVALLGCLFFFFCWRPRRANGEQGSGLNRNASVLSKVGLLRNHNHAPSQSAGYGNASPNAVAGGMSETSRRDGPLANQPPRLDTQFPEFYRHGFGEGPPSAATNATSDSRRGSRPIFVDQRLNPYAITHHQNASRSSIGTLEDNQDYSRRLEVKNPDPT